MLAGCPLWASAADCFKGYDSRHCLVIKNELQAQLNELYSSEEQVVLQTLKEHEQDFKDEVLSSLRATNTAYASFKDAECYSMPLRDGVSMKDSNVLADQCRVQWRQKRIADLRKRRSSIK
jgi:hypothetical protein